MDGVLVDSEPLHNQAWLRALAQWQLQPATDWFHPWVGMADYKLAAHLASTGAVPADSATILQAKRLAYDAICRAKLQAFAGVNEGLLALEDRLRRDHREPMACLAVCTSSARREALISLTLTNLVAHFSKLVCGDEVTRIKPDPEPYLKAAGLLGLPPAACIVLEDSRAGLTAAMAAGCYTLAITSTHAATELPVSHRQFPSTRAALDWLLCQP